jgi:hypothetical protein
LYTVVLGHDWQKNNSKKKTRIFRKLFFSKKTFLHGEKENFEEHSQNLTFVELTFLILINYLAGKNSTCPWTMVPFEDF